MKQLHLLFIVAMTLSMAVAACGKAKKIAEKSQEQPGAAASGADQSGDTSMQQAKPGQGSAQAAGAAQSQPQQAPTVAVVPGAGRKPHEKKSDKKDEKQASSSPSAKVPSSSSPSESASPVDQQKPAAPAAADLPPSVANSLGAAPKVELTPSDDGQVKISGPVAATLPKSYQQADLKDETDPRIENYRLKNLQGRDDYIKYDPADSSKGVATTIQCADDVIRQRGEQIANQKVNNRILIESGSKVVFQRAMDFPITNAGTPGQSGWKPYMAYICDTGEAFEPHKDLAENEVDAMPMSPGTDYTDHVKLSYIASDEGVKVSITCSDNATSRLAEERKDGVVTNRINMMKGSRILLQRDLMMDKGDHTTPKSDGQKPYVYYNCQ